MPTNGPEEPRLPIEPVGDRPVRLAVLISGGGTTLLNFQEEIAAGRLNAEIPLVIASRDDCAGVHRAAAAGLPVRVISRRSHSSTAAFSDAVFDAVREHDVDLVTLAGFLCLLTVPPDFAYRVLNIHPSLIPAFCGRGYHGRHVHEAAVRRGVKVSGCTVHFADNEYDAGPILLQRVVSVPDQCDPDQLAALVFAEETRAYPDAIRLIAEGRVRIVGQRTVVQTDA